MNQTSDSAGDAASVESASAAITGWHLHVYFDAETRASAQRVREAVEREFDIVMGRWHEKPVGPHPMWSYQIAAAPAEFARLLPWMALNREGLIVFIHPETGDAVPDHRDHAVWLGERLDLDLDALR
ncbi:MAG: DOPA 4,5-dioxygenase family protein [Alphaproteobacteria bacterium]|nr:DOPA 4,5-dioxygenase family protein [Alphaproteobacteria bacterium]